MKTPPSPAAPAAKAVVLAPVDDETPIRRVPRFDSPETQISKDSAGIAAAA